MATACIAALPFGANWFDFIWAIALVFGIWNGLRTGLLGEIIRFAGWVLMIWLGMRYYIPVGDWVKATANFDEEPARLTAFVAIVLVVYLVMLVIRKVGHRWMVKTKSAASLENFGGMILGALRMALVMTVLTIWLTLTRSPFWHKQVSHGSVCSGAVLRTVPTVAKVADKKFPEKFPFFKDLERPLDRDVDEDTVNGKVPRKKI